MDDHEVVEGIMHLFDHDTQEARTHFTGAVQAAQNQGRSPIQGELGLLLCTWCEEGNPDIDRELSEILQRMQESRQVSVTMIETRCPSCDRLYVVREDYLNSRVACVECKARFIVAEAPRKNSSSSEESRKTSELHLLNDDDLLLRDTRLWHVVSLLFGWRRLPPQHGLPAREWETLHQRLGGVREIDPALSDADLLEGLIAYYFSTEEEDRKRALEILQRAVDSGVNEPDILNLLEREKRVSERAADSLNRLLAEIRRYLEDPGVVPEYKEQLKARLERFRRFREMGEVDIQMGETEAAPSLEDMRNRGSLIRRRIATIVRPHLTKADEQTSEEITGLMDSLDSVTKTLAENVRTLQDTEHGLLQVTGEFLLQEEGSDEPEVPSNSDIEDHDHPQSDEGNGNRGKI
jgi:hypothetical protein